jgi:hypothetical protein
LFIVLLRQLSQQEDLIMAAKKTSSKGGTASAAKTGAGVAEHTKDAKTSVHKAGTAKAKPVAAKAAVAKSTSAKKTAAKAPAKASAPRTKSKGSDASIASKVIRSVKDTASGALSLAASVIGRDGGKAKSG